MPRMSSGFLDSIIGASVDACDSVGFAIIFTFGAVGGAYTSFAINEVPLCIVLIAILTAAYFHTVKGLTKECKISFNKKSIDFQYYLLNLE
jgi:hypothetical protein